jgi:hypothetical protein
LYNFLIFDGLRHLQLSYFHLSTNIPEQKNVLGCNVIYEFQLFLFLFFTLNNGYPIVLAKSGQYANPVVEDFHSYTRCIL